MTEIPPEGIPLTPAGISLKEDQHEPPDDGGKKPVAPPPKPKDSLRAVIPPSPLDKDGWPGRWSDPTYLGDGPWGA